LELGEGGVDLTALVANGSDGIKVFVCESSGEL
jgi:hypothetical protein